MLEKFSRYLVAAHGEDLAGHFARPSKVVGAASVGEERACERRRGARFASAIGKAAVRGRESTEPIAIIGMSGRFPMAKDVDELWENLRSGRDCISEIPPQ